MRSESNSTTGGRLLIGLDFLRCHFKCGEFCCFEEISVFLFIPTNDIKLIMYNTKLMYDGTKETKYMIP